MRVEVEIKPFGERDQSRNHLLPSGRVATCMMALGRNVKKKLGDVDHQRLRATWDSNPEPSAFFDDAEIVVGGGHSTIEPATQTRVHITPLSEVWMSFETFFLLYT
jgi:hypothetical protein